MNWVKLAKDVGFEDACQVNMASLQVMQEVRDMCAADRCRAYGTRWACPPGCGTLAHCRGQIGRYQNGVLVQTVGQLTDDFDAEGIEEAHKTHERRFRLLARQVRRLLPRCLPLCAGTCSLCEVCTYPTKPCRFPGKMLSSMEAYGLLVSDVCTRSGLPYYRGPRTITFTSCILLENTTETEGMQI